MVQEIRKFVWSFCIDENNHTFENEEQGVYGIEEVIKLAEDKFNVKIEFKRVGNYISCGYDMFCYSWACITPNGELYFDSCCTESY